MKLPLTAILSAAVLSASAATILINDLENGKTAGWGPYSDQPGPGSATITDDAVSGDNALKVTLEGCKQYRGIQYHDAPVMPEGATAVSFLIKPVTGAPPAWLALGEVSGRYGKVLARGRAPIKTTGSDWQKVTIPLSEMIGDIPGPDYEKPFSAFKPGAIYTFAFYVPVSGQRSVFLLDDIAWETK